MNFMRCFGLSDPTMIHTEGWDWWKKATWLRRSRLGNFDVEEYDNNQGGINMLTCCCGRSDAVYLTHADLKKANPIKGLHACEVCLDEIDACSHPRDQVAAFIRQNRSRIDAETCLMLPVPMCRLFSDKVSQRPRRFVYEVYHETKLTTQDKVLCTCGNSECVNPHHIHCAKSTSTKLTPEIKTHWAQWLGQGIAHRTIKDLTYDKFGRSLSIRTIGNFKRSLQQSQSTQSC